VSDRERVLREKIEKFQHRLEDRAKKENFDLTGVDYSKIDNPDRSATAAALITSLHKEARTFSYKRMVYIGKPAHLAKLSDSDLSLFIRLALERHDDAAGIKKGSIRDQAHQLHVIRNAHAEMLTRVEYLS
jgi:hypothetical protein